MKIKISSDFRNQKSPVSKKRARRRGLIYLSGYLCSIPMLAQADVSDTLNNFLGYLTGDIGKAMASLAIVSIGFGCFALGKIPKGYVIAVVIGVGVIFGTKAILGTLTG